MLSLLLWNLSSWFASSRAMRIPERSVADLLTSRWVREVFSRRWLQSHSHPVSVMEWSDSFSSVSVEFTWSIPTYYSVTLILRGTVTNDTRNTVEHIDSVYPIPEAFCWCGSSTPPVYCGAEVAKGRRSSVFGCRGERLPWRWYSRRRGRCRQVRDVSEFDWPVHTKQQNISWNAIVLLV